VDRALVYAEFFFCQELMMRFGVLIGS